MIRPSALSIAEHCQLAPVLAEEYPTTSDAIARGNLVDREVSRELLGGRAAEDADARACLARLRADGLALGAWPLFVQEEISFCDPKTGALVTRGTPDIVEIQGDCVRVVDLKKREQWYAGRLTEPDQNLQLHAYGMAWAIRSGATSYALSMCLFGDGDASMLWSKVHQMANSSEMLDRIRRINERSGDITAVGRPRPLPNAGPHCLQCYQRIHCPAWLLPAHEGETALTPLTSKGELTKDNAGRALCAVMALEEAASRAREVLKGFVLAEGPIVVGEREWGPVMMPGRKSGPSVGDLEAAGLVHLIKEGRPFEQWRLQKKRSQ